MSDSPDTPTNASRSRPVALYDANCPICRSEADRLVYFCGGGVDLDTLQSRSTDGTIPDEMKLEMPDGKTYGGAEAVARALVTRPAWWALVWIYYLPGIRQIVNTVYRWVADNRYRLSANVCPDGTCGPHAGRFIAGEFAASPALSQIKPTYRRSAKVFLVLLGVIYAITFTSTLSQVHILIGSDGLIPLDETLDRLREMERRNELQPPLERADFHPVRAFPTLFWLDSTDTALTAGCVIGLALSGCVIIGLYRSLTLPLMIVVYISFTVANQTFYSFQWDNLQIEAGIHALLLPAYSLVLFRRRSPKARAALLRLPHGIAIFMMHWFLFRLYFESGMAKVLAGGGGWREMWAMDFYYDTAPLPTFLGWYAHNMPQWWHHCEVGLTLFIELILPVFIFAGRRFRHFALLVFTAAQLGILLTANYGIFNYLSLILGVFLIEDRDYDRLLKLGRRLFRKQDTAPHDHTRIYTPSLFGMLLRTLILAAVAAAMFAASLVEFATITVRDPDTRRKLAEWRDPYAHMRLINAYHLFAGMTTERIVPEVQGLDENGNWIPFSWRFAPQDPKAPPRFAAPHQPRLDFQIWFSTLSQPFTRHTYLMRLVERLCTHPQLAARYFADDPFEGSPPKGIRVMGFRFKMSDPATRHETGDWWVREPAGQLLPPRSCAAFKPRDPTPTANSSAENN